MKMLKSKRGESHPIWGLISSVIGIIFLLALLRVIGIDIPFAEFVKEGISSMREILGEIKKIF